MKCEECKSPIFEEKYINGKLVCKKCLKTIKYENNHKSPKLLSKFYKNLLNKKYDQEWTNLKFNKEEKNWVKLK